MKFILVLVGAVLGGMFANDKMTPPKDHSSKTEIVYGTRVGPDGALVMVVTR